jgi:hypothetical protein
MAVGGAPGPVLLGVEVGHGRLGVAADPGEVAGLAVEGGRVDAGARVDLAGQLPLDQPPRLADPAPGE